MKKITMVLLVASMVIGLILTGCSSLKEDVKEALKEEGLDADAIMEDIAEINEDLEDTEDTEDKIEDTDENENTDTDTDENENTDEDITSVWGEIAKYEVDSIIEEKVNSGVYMLVYISKEETAKLVDYFDELLKDTEKYSCKRITEKEMVIDGYLRGTINGYSIIVAVEYDNFREENRVEFTSYKE